MEKKEIEEVRIDNNTLRITNNKTGRSADIYLFDSDMIRDLQMIKPTQPKRSLLKRLFFRLTHPASRTII